MGLLKFLKIFFRLFKGLFGDFLAIFCNLLVVLAPLMGLSLFSHLLFQI
jgi:hypothetical protein